MKIGMMEIYNALHNNSYETVAVWIRDNADNVGGGLVVLDNLIIIKEQYKDRIAAGEPISYLYSVHDWSKVGHEVPAITTRAKNFSKAMFRFVVEGFPVETKDEAARKLAICETNTCGYFDGSICRHTKCGCFSKIKTFFATEHCPIGKW